MTEETLKKILDHRFKANDDSGQSTVLVLGAGLHRQLAGSTADQDSSPWAAFCSWTSLLDSLAQEHSFSGEKHVDQSAMFESLLVERAAQANEAAHAAEQWLLAKVSKRLGTHPATPDERRRLGQVLAKTDYQDLIVLNLDKLVEDALQDADFIITPCKNINNGRHVARLTHHFAACRKQDGRSLRIWHSHGHCDDTASMQLGLRTYGVSIQPLVKAFKHFKQAERWWLDGRHWTASLAREWQRTRRSNPQTWFDLFMTSDLVFAGVGLDRAETDIWWALHQRQRNFARVAPEERRKTLYITAQNQVPCHVRTGPAGLEPIEFPGFDKVWQAVLGTSLKQSSNENTKRIA